MQWCVCSKLISIHLRFTSVHHRSCQCSLWAESLAQGCTRKQHACIQWPILSTEETGCRSRLVHAIHAEDVQVEQCHKIKKGIFQDPKGQHTQGSSEVPWQPFNPWALRDTRANGIVQAWNNSSEARLCAISHHVASRTVGIVLQRAQLHFRQYLHGGRWEPFQCQECIGRV